MKYFAREEDHDQSQRKSKILLGRAYLLCRSYFILIGQRGLAGSIPSALRVSMSMGVLYSKLAKAQMEVAGKLWQIHS